MTAPLPLPEELREQVLTAARQARPVGAAVPVAPLVTPAEAMRRAADAFVQLLAVLDAGQWRFAALRDLDVQGLVGHLIGVERDVQAALRGEPDRVALPATEQGEGIAYDRDGSLLTSRSGSLSRLSSRSRKYTTLPLRASSLLTRRLPMNPVAPVTKVTATAPACQAAPETSPLELMAIFAPGGLGGVRLLGHVRRARF